MTTINDQILTGNQYRYEGMPKKGDKLEQRVHNFDAVDILLVQVGDAVIGTTQAGFDLYIGRDEDDI